MEGESKEFSIPTPIKERTPDTTERSPQQMSRREFLKFTAAALVALTLPRPEFMPEVEGERTRYDLLRERISQSEGDLNLKEQFIDRIDKVERTQGTIKQFLTAYEEAKDSWGNPLLKTLYERKYADLPLPITERLFFLRDNISLQNINQTIDGILEDLSWTNIDQLLPYLEEITLFVSPEPQADPEIERRRVSIDYTEIGSEKPGKKIETVTRVPPGTEEGRRLFEQDKKTFEAIFEKLPRLRNIRIELYNPERYEYQEEENPPRLDGYFFPTEEEDRIGIKIETSGISERNIYVAYHEWAHSIDLLNNKFLKRKLTPQQIIDLMILQEQAHQSEYGRNYPRAEEIFTIEKRSWPESNKPVGPEDFRLLTGRYPDNIWATRRGPESAPYVKPKGDIFYHTAWVAQALGLQDFRPLLEVEAIPSPPKEGEETFSNLDEFLQSHRQEIEKIIRKYPRWKVVFELLERNKNLWAGENIWYSRVTPTYHTEPGWWGYIFSVSTNILLADAFYSGNKNVLESFTKEQLAATYYNMKWVLDLSDSEKWAESLSLMLILARKGRLSMGEVPYFNYLFKYRLLGISSEGPQEKRRKFTPI
jgi:hypothetical protein